jgi:hypothetical protein
MDSMKECIMSKKIFLIIAFILVFGIICSMSFASVGAAISSKPSVCCEKTIDGAYCLNVEKEKCDAKYKVAPTTCSATSYCALGTCYDSTEGLCLENTPKLICDAKKGTWTDQPASALEQCKPGCCVIGDQIAFVPQIRCKRLSTFYGIANIDFRADLKTETECLSVLTNQDVGACVFEEEYQRTCKLTTREDCGGKDGTLNLQVSGKNKTLSNEKTFYKSYLCSADELNTNCAKQVSTGCYRNKVYWLDSCGNRENVYSNDKDKSWNSGKMIISDDSICSPENGNNVNCGNCDYLLGTRCGLYEKGGIFATGKPQFGNYYCKRTECKDSNGMVRKNGEAWCVTEGAVGDGQEPVGSRHFKRSCIDGNIVTEACADYRDEICVQDSISTNQGSFSVAGCRQNRWRDCITQTRRTDCENTDRRDCKWRTIEGVERGFCVPNFAPGLKFWESGDAQTICAQGTVTCKTRYTKAIGTVITAGEGTRQGSNCESEAWAKKANDICKSMGDCGAAINYAGTYSGEGYDWKISYSGHHENNKFSATIQNQIVGEQKRIGVYVVKRSVTI